MSTLSRLGFRRAVVTMSDMLCVPAGLHMPRGMVINRVQRTFNMVIHGMKMPRVNNPKVCSAAGTNILMHSRG